MEENDPVTALKEQVQRWRGHGEKAELDLDPGTVYEVVTRQMVEDLRDELREIRARINSLIFLLVSTVVGEVLLRLVTERH